MTCLCFVTACSVASCDEVWVFCHWHHCCLNLNTTEDGRGSPKESSDVLWGEDYLDCTRNPKRPPGTEDEVPQRSAHHRQHLSGWVARSGSSFLCWDPDSWKEEKAAASVTKQTLSWTQACFFGPADGQLVTQWPSWFTQHLGLSFQLRSVIRLQGRGIVTIFFWCQQTYKTHLYLTEFQRMNL